MPGLKPARRPGAALCAVALAASVAAVGDPATGAARAGAPDPVADAPATVVTVRPDPAYRGQQFQGWGTSLVWFANATGSYPDEIRDRLAELLFGDDGLSLNIARYNIGGGNAPDVPDYLRPGGAVPGWWQAPAGTTRDDRDWWDPDDPTHWNWAADPAQRWWVDRIKADVTHWETFSNSPPWFQTVSGYVSGGFDATADQIRPDTVDDFATYLVRVTEHLERSHGIDVATIDPLNEPNTPYWSTRLGPDGQPVGGRQEGAHAGPASQQQVIDAVDAALRAAGSDTVISAMDETNPGTFLTNWNAYGADVRDRIAQLNVHTYGTGQRTAVRDVAKAEGKPLWMSEVEGSYGSGGQDFTSMLPGLGIAQHVVDDLRELEPSAWVLWQPVEDYDNMAPGGEFPLGSNWGSIQVPFDCTAADTLQTCPIHTNTKFDTLRNFTHHIRPGDRLMAVDDPNSVAAIATGKRATVVHVNASTDARTVALDLSAFRVVAPDATVTPVVTSAAGALRTGTPVAVTDRTARLDVPARSVTTFLIDGVSGVLLDESLIRDDHVYRIDGVPSGRSLTPAGDAPVIRTGTPHDPAQLWQLTRLTDGFDNQARYAVGTVDGQRRLAVVDGAAAIVPADGVPAPAAQWMLSTTGDGTYTFVNVATGRLLDVSGQATHDGAAVSVWLPNSGANQRWRILDEKVVGLEPVDLFTTPGTAPTLPASVVALHRDGPGGPLPVTWRDVAPVRWKQPGTVPVSGRVTDAQGRTHLARANVVVDTLAATEPARAKAFVGGRPDLPATVTALSSQGLAVDRPVRWDAAPPGAFDQPGVVTVTGRADAGDGAELPATVRVQVTPPVEAPTAVSGIDATFTEPGYSTVGLTNGDRTDKAWSNWRPGAKNPTDTLTVALPREHSVAWVAVHFYRDGADSYASGLRAQVRDDHGDWVDAGGPVDVPVGTPTAPVVEVPVTAVTDAVRIILTAYPDRHITLSEIEVAVAVPGTSAQADAAAIALDGVPLAGFDPATTRYAVPAGPRLPHVTATAVDPYAEITVTQADAQGRAATVEVTGEDGTRIRTYRIDFT
ncbi:Ig-like domain-containing protein [Solwaraspora sp. WMMB762]|uniref:Ig-like domain-containing protein n=1 Tax=Solwaraspora sp. WMMB762 TaxID=3404120 RepID=UPI003B94DAE0